LNVLADLYATCHSEENEPIAVEGVLGVDLGVMNIATDSDGTIHQDKALKNIRYRHRCLRNKLQKKDTKGSRRRLRMLAGQERRFATWVNHNLSRRAAVNPPYCSDADLSVAPGQSRRL
jgi:transposase